MILNNVSNFKQRLAVSTIATTLVLAAIILSSYPLFRPLFACVVAAAIAFGLWEYYRIALAKGYQPLVKMGIAASVLYVMGDFLCTQEMLSTLSLKIFATFCVIAFSIYYLFYNHDPLINLSLTIFGLLYIAIPISLMININYFFPNNLPQDGRWWLFYLIAVTKMTDMGGYFIGKKLGKHKLAPDISPKKTVEGAIGGLIFSILTSLIFYFISSVMEIKFSVTLMQSIALGVCIGVIGQVGDLIESLFKRDAGIKDSNQLPGLGGVLDMMDSLIFTTPVIYFFLKLVYS